MAQLSTDLDKFRRERVCVQMFFSARLQKIRTKIGS